MEAWRFGFGDHTSTSSGYKFDPTDADIVASYLLPRALQLGNPYELAIIDDDPVSLPPWQLLHKHGHAGSDHAFFFGPVADKTENGGRKNRTVKAEAGAGAGGTWRGQKGSEESLTLMSPEGCELDIRYKRYNLSYYRAGEEDATGWVMHEYEITWPPLPRTVLTRIRITDRGKGLVMKGTERQQAEAEALAAGADQQVFPDPEKPGPSHQYHACLVAGSAIATGDGEGYSVAQNDVVHGDNAGGMGETGGYSNYYNAGAIATSLHYTDGREGGGDYSNHYNAGGGDFSNYYIAGDGDDNMYYEAGGDVKHESDDGQEYGH